MLSHVISDTIYSHDVLLLDEGIQDSMAKCVALACSTDYHMTGDYEVSDNPLILSLWHDKCILIYNKADRSVISHSEDGAGYVLLFKVGQQYKLASILDRDRGQHLTCFSRYHPLIVAVMEHV